MRLMRTFCVCRSAHVATCPFVYMQLPLNYTLSMLITLYCKGYTSSKDVYKLHSLVSKHYEFIKLSLEGC